jgi:hypothetical protein
MLRQALRTKKELVCVAVRQPKNSRKMIDDRERVVNSMHVTSVVKAPRTLRHAAVDREQQLDRRRRSRATGFLARATHVQ